MRSLSQIICSILLGLPLWLSGTLALRATAVSSSTAVEVAEIESQLDRGIRLYQIEQFNRAIELWQPACKRLADLGENNSQALCWSYLSLAYQQLGEWSAATDAIDRSLKLLQSKAEAMVLAHALNTQGRLLLARGQPELALETWKKAEAFYQEAGDVAGRFGSQINQAGALQSLGFYRRSRQVLEKVRFQLQAEPNSQIKAAALTSFGSTLQLVGELQNARDILEQSLAIATDLGTATSAILLALGNIAYDLQQPQVALDYFEKAQKTAANLEEKLDAQLARLSLYREFEQGLPGKEMQTLVAEIYSSLPDLPPSRLSVYAAVNFAEHLLKIEVRELSDRQLGRVMSEATAIAKSLGDRPAEAYALLQWGKLYEQNGQVAEAIRLTEESLAIAQSIQATDIVSQSAWQLGRIFKNMGKEKAAIAAYSEAVNALQSLRGDLVAINPDVQFSFRESVEPVYREMVAMLLDKKPSQENLRQARELIEALQLAELDNFFRDACLDAAPVTLDKIDPTAAIIYPIILSDRLAVILSAPGQPLQYSFTPLSSDQIQEIQEELLSSLSPDAAIGEHLPFAQQLHDWLIGVAAKQGVLKEVKTLVFVLDGALRELPMAVLHDGQRYLIENYNIVISQGLQLVDPRQLDKEELSAIAAGLTEARQGFSAIPAVEGEINQIASNIPVSVLLNDEFTRGSLFNQVQKNSASVVHLATHGQFSSKLEDTFLLAWEGRIGVKDLDQLLSGRETARYGAIELLVLSACETAVGDDRALLGLAGLALRSGARSTLATLWVVRDRSTAILMAEFYKHLQSPGVMKAEALRRAQLALLANPNYKEPFFWAPFILVGNWL